MKTLTGSNSAAGLTFFVYACGVLVAPVSGVIVDRVRRSRLLICTNLAAAAWVCALLFAGGRGEVWLIYLVMFGYGVISSLVMSGQGALLAFMLPEDLLGEANSALQTAELGFRVVTPLLAAGLLTEVGPKPVVLIDAGTFLAAGLALLSIRLREPRPEASDEHWLSEAAAGIRFIRKTPELLRLMVASVVAALVFGFLITVPYAVAASDLHRKPTFVGVLEAVSGAGALIAGPIAARVMRRIGESRLVAAGLLVCALGALCLMTPWLPIVLIGMGSVGICLVWTNVGTYTLIQVRTPQQLMGRVGSAMNIATLIPQLVSIALGAALIAAVSYRPLLIAVALVLAVSTFMLMGKTPEVSQEFAEPAADAQPSGGVLT